MKRLILSLILCLAVSEVYAGWPPTREEWMNTPSPSYSSQGVYRSTQMTLLYVSTWAAVISTYASVFHTAWISSPVANSWIDFYDSRLTTVAYLAPLMFSIDNSRTWQYPQFDVFFASGIVAMPRGQSNPNSGFSYRER